MLNYSDRLNNLDDQKLMDVVKNYRQYGYDDTMRSTAISILNSRGITDELLHLTGNFENTTYVSAQESFNSFKKNSRIALLLYIIVLIANIVVPIVSLSSESIATLILIVNFILLIAYFIFLISSFLDQNRFYKSLNRDFGTEGALIYLLLGMPFYIIMYFYFRNQMIDKMKEIR